jgi:hypothetical protein
VSNLEFFQVSLRELAELGSHKTLEEKVVRLLRGRFPIDPAVSAALKQWAQSSLVALEPEPIEEISALVVPGTGQRTIHYHFGPNRRLIIVLQTTLSELERAEKRRNIPAKTFPTSASDQSWPPETWPNAWPDAIEDEPSH